MITNFQAGGWLKRACKIPAGKAIGIYAVTVQDDPTLGSGVKPKESKMAATSKLF